MRADPRLKSIVPDEFILPFGYFMEYADRTGLTPLLTGLSKIKLSNKYLISAVSAQVHEHIRTHEIPDQMLEEVMVALEKLGASTGNKHGYFFRSDTNIEDLPGFNGAGLNESEPNVPVDRAKVSAAIRTVWISPFKEKSIFWRGLALGQPAVAIAEPSIVVLATINAESSGVMISRGGPKWELGKGMISSNWGIGSVVGAGNPTDEISFYGAKAPHRYSFTVSREKPMASPSGGFKLEPVAPGLPVISTSSAIKLRDTGNIIERLLGIEKWGWDIEWAIDAEHKDDGHGGVRILQARPSPG